MLRIVVLLKSIAIGKSLTDEREKPVSQDLGDIEFCIHYSFKNNEFGWPPLRNPTPHVNFKRMLWFPFQPWLLPLAMESNLTVILEKN